MIMNSVLVCIQDLLNCVKRLLLRCFKNYGIDNFQYFFLRCDMVSHFNLSRMNHFLLSLKNNFLKVLHVAVATT